MAFGSEIGGFKYTRPGRLMDGLKNFEDDPSHNDVLDLPAVALNNGPMRAVTAFTNRSTQNLLLEVSKMLDETIQPIPDEKAVHWPLSLDKANQDQVKRGLSSVEVYDENKEEWLKTVTPTQLLTEEYKQGILRIAARGAHSLTNSAIAKRLTGKDKDICTSENTFSFTETWKSLRTKLEELFIENRDMDKSIERGWRDVVSGNPLKTEMKNKIREQLLDPLKEYISKEQSIPVEKRTALTAALEKIEQNHFVAKGGKGS